MFKPCAGDNAVVATRTSKSSSDGRGFRRVVLAGMLFIVVWQSQFVFAQIPNLQVGEITVLPMDVACLAVIAVCLPRIFILTKLEARYWVWGFVACVVVGCTWSILQIGVQPGVNSWRYWVLFVSCLVFGATTYRREVKSGLSVFAGFGILAAAIEAFGLLFFGFASHPEEHLPYAGLPLFYGSRTLGYPAAYLIVVAIVVMMLSFDWWFPARYALVTALSIAGIYTQIRVIWGCLAISLLLICIKFLRQHQSPSRSVAALCLPTLAIALVLLPTIAGVKILPGDSSIAQTSVSKAAIPEGAKPAALEPSPSSTTGSSLQVSNQQLAEIFSGTENPQNSFQTINWRLRLWLIDLSGDRSPTEWIKGYSSERLSPRVEYFGPTINQVSAHNEAIETLRYLGLFGLVTLTGLYFQALRRANRLNASLSPILITLLWVGITDQFPAFAGVFIGYSLISFNLNSTTATGRWTPAAGRFKRIRRRARDAFMEVKDFLESSTDVVREVVPIMQSSEARYREVRYGIV